MSSCEDIIKENDNKNWLKGSIALIITKEGLQDLVDGDCRSIQQGIHASVLQARNLSPGTTCCKCLTENLFQCPTRGLCSHFRNCKLHDTPVKMYRPCPSHICDDFRNEICLLKIFGEPSWKNSHADRWCSNHWEIAKCFMPPDGYKDVSSFVETDFNGIISILINCKAFQQRLSFKVDTVPNILTQARVIGRTIRHSPDLKVTDTDLNDYITTLTTLLSDPTYLSNDRKAQEAVLKLNQLQAGMLCKTREDARAFLEKHKIEQAVTEGVNRLYSRTTEGIEALDEAVLEAIGKIRASDEDKEADLQQRLAKNYQKTLSSVPISPLLPDRDEMLDKLYVAPRIIEKDHKKVESSQQRKETPVSSYKNIFCKGDTFLSNIYVIGEAGMGKSTFSITCALNWGKQILHSFNFGSISEHEFQDVEVLAKFDFLFHVSLRNSGELCNLTDMITDQILSRIYLADEEAAGNDTLLSVLSTRKILILADGLDEWSHPSGTKCSCKEEEKVVPFLSPTIDATVVITSRPWRMAQHRVRDSRIDRFLEIEGVADTKRLAQNVLGCLSGKTESEQKSKAFMSFIKKRDLSNLLSVPTVLMMLVCLWFEGVGESFSLCEIYGLMIDMMFGSKTLKKHYRQQVNTTLPSCFQNAKHIFKNIPALLSSAKLAFDQLFSTDKKSALVFKQVGSLSHEDMEFMLKTGIIRETKSQSFIMQSSSFSFIHKTVQEFLAALHLSYNPDEFNRVVEPFYNRSGQISDISQVFIYICGLNSEIGSQMSTIICNAVPVSCSNQPFATYYDFTIDHPENSVVCILQYLFGKGHMEACANNVADDIHLNLYFYIFDYITENDSTLKTLLSMNKSQVRYLRVDGCEAKINEEEIQKVFSLSADTLIAVELTDRGGRYDLSSCRQLKFLRIIGNEISSINVNAESLVTCEISSTSSILQKEVLYSLNRLNEGNRCSPLKHLKLRCIEKLDLYCQTLTGLSQLEYVYIGNTDLNDHLLNLPRSVIRVHLSKVEMKAGVFWRLVEWIEKSTHTVDCFLRQCTVTPSSEFKKAKLYVQSYVIFTVFKDGDDTFSFKRNI
ncbi:uncharacterized protein LOC128209898 [Mya arenaria]|uniref:uncharacterized protein LOC128209898 n=1 Tax=Mya arenaria TaxID=6604 RepID=UPI0022E61355|nr:uncharacterized protein LOC128209898 [Mya arenaria]